MYVTEISNNLKHEVKVQLLDKDDYKQITKSRYYFDWKTERKNKVCKLVLQNEILGLMSFIYHVKESRIEIKLLAVSKENRGQSKKYDRVTGTLIGYACRESIKLYGFKGCVSLVPKTQLKKHYAEKFKMIYAGQHMFLEGQPMLDILNEYEL